MPERRTNKATISDTTMEDAFRQGFEEGVRQAASGAQVMYEFTATFEGTDLRRVQFSDLDQAIREARELLTNGAGTEIKITAVAVATPPTQEPRAVAEAQVVEDDGTVEEGEIVDDPSRED